ncbi:Collagen alpha-1(XVI) chain [Triplophysa tibetana]|uniref:Collagen alpha-1(XVI) chain n=1 Tax=Triplophysa tibetana TaxID=1572043 RepID=A0A5A9NMA3_9TELE|nr:Collagen alpha-1(XVI) chain [Triplophysa tibetana]
MRVIWSSLVLLTIWLGHRGRLASAEGVSCPSMQVEEWKFSQSARHNITGFNLVRSFSLLKNSEVKKIRNPRGPLILRLGKVQLIQPTE